MKHHLFIISFFLFCFNFCNAQARDNSTLNALSLELGKTGLIYNLNFDHKFRDKNYGFRLSVGSNLAKYLSLFSTGGGGYYLTGKSNNHLELGLDINYLAVDESSDDERGVILVYPDYSINTYYASANIGYRKYGKKSMFRIGISPGFTKDEFIPGGYISYGLRF
ncbi:MAG: hypothetical protein ABIN94_14905 [Ferruginibacter sp.]